MHRRKFITLLGGTAAAFPRPLLAQQADSLRRIGVLLPYAESDSEAQAEVAAFRAGLEKLGWVDSRTARIEYRWASNDRARISAAAKELVDLKCEVILGRATPVTTALQAATRSVPIVFVNVSDPVGSGFAASMARPGGNATGFTNVEAPLAGKWVEVLKEIDPRIVRLTGLFDPHTSPAGGKFYMQLVQDAARSITVDVAAAPIHDDETIERAVAAIARQSNSGMIVLPDTTNTNHRAAIIESAARHRVPTMYPYRFFVQNGGLASYGLDLKEVYRQAASYVDRILRGEKPGDLPVQAPAKFELAVNAKTAKALGLVLSPMLLGRADDVIE
jgi:putative ABC transport system substrate-binding protein